MQEPIVTVCFSKNILSQNIGKEYLQVMGPLRRLYRQLFAHLFFVVFLDLINQMQQQLSVSYELSLMLQNSLMCEKRQFQT